MVFCGKPSKACERCRVRRLKCDLRSEACGQCVRASVPCSGYRDTQQLRVRNESQSVAKKALKTTHRFEPQYLPLSIDLQAHHAFFAYYVASKCWDCLKPYEHPIDSPKHLTLAIEAVSLAYFWHQVYSDAALAAARQRYVSALRMANKTLKSPNEATKDSTLLASILLDLFEKITYRGPRDKRLCTSHVDGALALVRLRGVEQFQDPSGCDILVRLSTNFVMNCLASGIPVPDDLNAIQAYIGKRANAQEPTLRLSNLMFQYANLCGGVRGGGISTKNYMGAASELDAKLQALDLELPSYWQYDTTLLEHKSEWAFDLHFHSYANPRVCMARNALRVLRILLNEALMEHYLLSCPDDSHPALMALAHKNIETLAGEICASVPQYVDCNGAARKRISTLEESNLPDPSSDDILDRVPRGTGHSHTLNHQLDCYALIFPLYVVGMCRAVPDLGPWVIKQLHRISSHFCIRNAEVVAQLLEQGTNVAPWDVYAMLGSYAFAA